MTPLPGSGRTSRLAVVVVSYNVRELLGPCLHSVLASAQHSSSWLQVDVVVVDNASADGSASMVAETFPQVHLMALDTNLGFAGGNNWALRALGLGRPGTPEPAPWAPGNGVRLPSPDFVLLLNPDTEVMDDALGRMAAFLRDCPRAGACGARLCYPDGRFQHAAFRFPGPLQVALDILPLEQVPGLARFLPALLDSPLNGRYPQALWDAGVPFPVDFVLGAALMVRREAVLDVGLLDEGYFMYCEEMDWCLRMHRAGWAVHAVPRARVVHHQGASSRQTHWPSFVHLWTSRARFYARHADRFPRGTRATIQTILHLGLAWRRHLAWRRFAQGRLDGVALAAELDAYRAVARAWSCPGRGPGRPG